MIFNVYCDESGHLEHDEVPVMVLGAIWCPFEQTRVISVDIREIKRKHGLAENYEIKWNRVSEGKINFYTDLVRYFFRNPDLHFRALIVPDKSKLRHAEHHQNHNDFYYKMYFDMLKTILNPVDKYRIYLDIKDTRGGEKVRKLHEILCNNIYDFSRSIIDRLQLVNSQEIEQIQLADLLIGVISYANRSLKTSPAKLAVVEKMRQMSGYKLTQTTLYRENKVNLFRWRAREVDEE